MSELVTRQEELEKTNRQLALDVQVSYLHQVRCQHCCDGVTCCPHVVLLHVDLAV